MATWNRRPKRVLYTLAVNNFDPEICDMTFPLMKHLADKAAADFFVIRERRWPDLPVNLEKFGIWFLAQEHRAEEILFLDADTMVHPDMWWPFDVEPYKSKATVFHNAHDMAAIRWRYNKYLWRDGRNLGSGTWTIGCTDWTLDLFKPPHLDPDMPTIAEAVESITPIVMERKTIIDKHHLLDDFYFSCNIARYGLKFKGLMEANQDLKVGGYFWHQYVVNRDTKILQMKGILGTGYMNEAGQQVPGWNLL